MLKLLFLSSILLVLWACDSKNEVQKDTTTSSTVNGIPAIKEVQEIKETHNMYSFIPEGYIILDSTIGDLNKDSLTRDILLALKKKDEISTEELPYEEGYSRPLLILIASSDGGYELAGRNDHSIYGASDGGMYGCLLYTSPSPRDA